MSAIADLFIRPGRFAAAAAEIRRARVRPELQLTRIRVPEPPARDSLAFAAAVPAAAAGGHPSQRPLAEGRFILLHDPARAAEWGGPFRIVTYVQAQVDGDMGHDRLLGGVAWSWLLDALAATGAEYFREGGTASRIIQEGFGRLAGDAEDLEVELRASWTPHGRQLRRHLEAWGQMVASFAGLPPQEPAPQQVASLHPV